MEGEERGSTGTTVRMNEDVKESGVKFSMTKCGVMVMTKKRVRSNKTIMLDGVELRKVLNVKYLGSMIEENNGTPLAPRAKRQKLDKHGRTSAFEKLKQLKGNKHKYEVSIIDNVYEEVDEKEYSEKVLQRQDDDWIVDDDGCGYVEDGREIFDDDLDDDSIFSCSRVKSKDSKTQKRGRLSNKIVDKNAAPESKLNNIRNMLLNMPTKKKEETVKLDEDDILGDIMQELNSDNSNVIKPFDINLARRTSKQMSPSKKLEISPRPAASQKDLNVPGIKPGTSGSKGGRIEGREGWRTLQTRGEGRFGTVVEKSRSSVKAEPELFFPFSLLAEHVVELHCWPASTRLQSVCCIWRERRSLVKLVPRVDLVRAAVPVGECYYIEVALRVSHSSLMSSDRMKPGSGDWADDLVDIQSTPSCIEKFEESIDSGTILNFDSNDEFPASSEFNQMDTMIEEINSQESMIDVNQVEAIVDNKPNSVLDKVLVTEEQLLAGWEMMQGSGKQDTMFLE
uniref:(California timema) hypothetical protein n=1 Tax=Timema californicum TaxID=61474 RepID=A0A7R9J7U6_TIMCA|nr:unnamed protein product [Timema californicum]